MEHFEIHFVLFSPVSCSSGRMFIRQVIGPETDYLPLVHPRGLKQSLFMDYTNMLGKGHTALFLSSPQNQYYLYVCGSFTEWLETHLRNLKLGLYQGDKHN